MVDVFGKGPAQCNGAVGGDKIWLTGAELRRQTNNPTGGFTLSSPSGNPDIPPDCGHPSQIEVTVSVSVARVYSLRQFMFVQLREPQRPSIGFKEVLLPKWPQLFEGNPTSVKGVIESWQLAALPPH